MILQELYNLAQREGLMDDPNYEPKPVPWIIELAEGGRFLGLVRTQGQDAGQSGKRKRKDKGKVFMIPRQPRVTSGIKPSYLVGNFSYILGVDEKNPARGPEKLKAFTKLIRRTAETSEDEALKAVLSFLDNEEQRKACLVEIEKQERTSSSEQFAFRYIGELVHNRTAAKQFWANLCAEATSSEKDCTTCLITGKPCTPVDLHPVLKNVPGGGTTGVSLVSFNKDAFESFGLSGSQNAPISRDASYGFTDALNRLLHPQPFNPRTGESLTPLNKRLSSNTIAIFWSRDESEFTAAVPFLMEADPDTIKKVFESPWRGKLPPNEDISPFFAVVLSGAQGRATLRRWHTATIAETYRNIRQYYDDLEIFGQDHYPSIFAILSALSATSKDKNIPPNFPERIFLAGISGGPFPRAILETVVRRVRTKGEITRPRIALIKACLCRELRRPGSNLKLKYPELTEVTKAMDAQCNNTGYRLGRLFATLEGLQAAAQGKLNTTITRKFYSAASTRPALVFGNLLSLARHHIEKTGYAPRYEKLIEEILDPLPPDNAFPRVLGIEEQALFALGYYHQKQDLFKKKTDGKPAGQPQA